MGGRLRAGVTPQELNAPTAWTPGGGGDERLDALKTSRNGRMPTDGSPQAGPKLTRAGVVVGRAGGPSSAGRLRARTADGWVRDTYTELQVY